MDAKRRNRLDDIHGDVPLLEERHLELPRKNLQATGEVIPGKGNKKIGQLFRMPHLEGKTWRIPTEWVTPNPNQPRTYKDFCDADEEGDEDDGQIQPIMVVPYGTETGIRFLIVGGELRWLRARKQKIPTIAAQVIWKDNMDDLFEIATLENEDRRDLNPMEKARAYSKIMNSYIAAGKAPDDIRAREMLARRLHRKPSYLVVYLKLLKLHEVIQEAIGAGILSGSQGERMLVKELRAKETQELLAKKLLEEVSDPPKLLDARTVDRIIREVKAQINVEKGPAPAGARGVEKTSRPNFAPGKPETVHDMCHVIEERALVLISSIDVLISTLDGDKKGTSALQVRGFMNKRLGATLQETREAIKTLRVLVE